MDDRLWPWVAGRRPVMITIQGRKNGSVRVPGPLTLNRPSGEAVRIEKETVGLCRCGGSKDKPLCDGTHRANGFEADEFTILVDLPATAE